MLPQDLVSHSFQFEIVDGRLIEGTILAIDDAGTILLADGCETNGDIKRDIGLVSIPRKTVAKVLADEGMWKKISTTTATEDPLKSNKFKDII